MRQNRTYSGVRHIRRSVNILAGKLDSLGSFFRWNLGDLDHCPPVKLLDLVDKENVPSNDFYELSSYCSQLSALFLFLLLLSKEFIKSFPFFFLFY